MDISHAKTNINSTTTIDTIISDSAFLIDLLLVMINLN